MSYTVEQLELFVYDFTLFRYFIVAPAALLAYDYLLVLSDEVKYVWRTRLSIVKVLYLSDRLLSFSMAGLTLYMFFGATSAKTCRIIVITIAQINGLVFNISESLLLARVYAIWGCSKRILALSLTMYFGGFTAVVYILVKATSTVVGELTPIGKGCLLSTSSLDAAVWVCYLVFVSQDFCMLVLMSLRAFLVMRHESKNALMKGFRLLVTDGFLYFMSIFFVSLASVLVARIAPVELRMVLTILSGTLQSLVSTRLLLRLRESFSRAHLGETELEQMSRMDFGSSKVLTACSFQIPERPQEPVQDVQP